MTLKARVATGLTLSIAAQPCIAAAPDTGLGGLLWFLPLLIFGLFVLLGGMKGVALYLALLGGFGLWATLDNHQNIKTIKIVEQATSDRCFYEAGTFGTPISYVPTRILIKVAQSQLDESYWDAMRTKIDTTNLGHPFEFVETFPLKRTDAEAYVEIVPIREQIKGGNGRYVSGISVTVSDASGAEVARQLDYIRRYGWCLGGSQPSSIERFLLSILGSPVRLSGGEISHVASYPTLSPKGLASVKEKGRFYETTRSLKNSKADEMEKQLKILPKSMGCRYQSEQTAICREGTPEQNTLNLNTLSATYELPNSWLGFFGSATDAIGDLDSIRIEERTKQGAILKVWHVRFPSIAGSSKEQFKVRNIVLDGRKFTADLVFSWQTELDGPPSKATSIKDWYEYRSTISATLD